MPASVVRSFRTRMRRQALAAAVVAALGAPAVCAALVVSAARAQADVYALQIAAVVRDIASERETVWQYDSMRIVYHLRAYRAQADIGSVRLFDADGRPVSLPGEPETFAIASGSAPVYLDGRRIGTVVVDMAPGPAARIVGVVAAVAAALGVMLAGFGYRIPVREVAAAASRLEATQRALVDARAAAAAADAEEATRSQIARDLHDGLGQELVGLRLELERLDREGTAGSGSLAPARKLVDTALTDVRRAVRALRPAALDDLGLGPALEAMARGITATGGPAMRVTADPKTCDSLEAPERTVLFRAAQELVTNVRRHARAAEIEVVVAAGDDDVTLAVSDDGSGMPAEVPAGGGLGGLRERLGALGGTLEITRPARGSCVVARIPRRKPPSSATMET